MKSSRARPISVVSRQSMEGWSAKSRWSSCTTCKPTASSVRMSLPRPSRRRRDAGEAGDSGPGVGAGARRLMLQFRSPKAEGRKKAETRGPKLEGPGSLLDELADQGALAVVDVHAQRQVAWERVRRAAEAGIVGPESHLDLVEQALGDVAAFDQALGRLFHAHGNAGGVVRRGDHQVGHRDQAALLGFIMVEEGAARGFHDANADFGHIGRDPPHFGTGDLDRKSTRLNSSHAN